MSQPSSRKKRRPPQRLSWPTSLSHDSSAGSFGFDGAPHSNQRAENATGKDANISGRKRARKSAEFTPNTAETEYYSSKIWCEKFAPKSSADLCVAPKKLKEIKSWVQNSLSSIAKSQNQEQQKLLILVGSPGIGKSTTVRILARELNISILSWNESHHPGISNHAHSRGLFSVERMSALNSFNEFLQQSGCGIAPLHVESSSKTKSINNGKTVILLEDLPNLHGASAELRFRSIMRSHLQRSRVPTILIFSDVSEGKHRPEDLERLVDQDILYNNEQTTIMQIHSVTKPKMKRILTMIAKQENYRLSPNFLEEIHHQSNGDIRHAILTLQLHATGRPKADSSISTSGKRGQKNRDTKLSTFHSLGKLLYAKRIMDTNGVSRLAFDPEVILERSDLGMEGSLRFLQFHSADFFTDIIELSTAYSSFSDAADILGNANISGGNRGTKSDSSSVFPYECAASIAGRTMASANIHPAPNKFRAFSRPKVFDVIRNGRQNQILIDQLSRRFSTTLYQSSSVSTNFVTESLPFLRQISPQEVDPHLDNLYSIAMQNHNEKALSTSIENNKELDLQKEQQTLLEIDDIDEFDSDN